MAELSRDRIDGPTALQAASAPLEPRPTPTFDALKYRADVDGLRAIAVLAVVGFHAAPGRLPSGFIGVDVFFVISGFLISSILLGSVERGNLSIADFYVRRIKRIFPALLLVLFATIVVGYFTLLPSELRALGKHIVGGATFLSNVVLWSESGYFDESANAKPLLHLWSLGIEEQFYIVWPFLIWAASKRNVRYLTMTLTIAALSFALNVRLSGVDSIAAFYSPLSRFWELLVGSTLAYFARRHAGESALEPKGFRPDAYAAAGAIMLATAFVTIDESSRFPGWWATLPTFGTALVIWAGPTAWLNRVVLSNPALVWFGLISFPLYLWHWPLLSFPRIFEGTEIAQWKRALAVGVSIALAWLTYVYIEQPIRHRASSKVPLRLLSLMAVTGLAGVGCYAGSAFAWRPWSPRVANVGDIGHDAFFGHLRQSDFPCTPESIRRDAAVWNGIVRCFQSKNDAVATLAIIGDSHAEHLFPGIAEHLPALNVVYYGMGGLPFTDNADFARIFGYVLHDSNIGTVVLAANWNARLERSEVTWRRRLEATISALTRAGKRVFIIDDVPSFSFMPSRCKYAGRLGLANQCSEPDRHENARYVRAFEDLSRENGRATTIETYGAFCRDEVCSMARGGNLLFRDEDHLNITGSTMLGANIVEQMQDRRVPSAPGRL